MLHYFNPGHEAAVLNASKYYMPPANQVKMQQDLAFLPAWYANPEDDVWVSADLPSGFPLQNQAITSKDFIHSKNRFVGQEVSLWGLAPQAIHLFEQINRQHGLSLKIPAWKEVYRNLSSRHTAKECLLFLIDKIPEIHRDILPEFHSRMDTITEAVKANNYKQLIKTPYSSSGRGLLWLPPGELSDSAGQILRGMLKKQATVSIERVLNKQLDFSMHFTSEYPGKISFTGYSVFKTDEKGAYRGSLIASQELLEGLILDFISQDLSEKVRQGLISFLKEKVSAFYQGPIGVDMLIYESNGQVYLHPCVEINMRKSMGYLGIQLQKRHLSENAHGFYSVDFDSQSGGVYMKHKEMQQQLPVTFSGNKIESGYFALCPVRAESKYRAYIIVDQLT